MGLFSSSKRSTTNNQYVSNYTTAADNGGAVVGGNYTIETVNDDIVSDAMSTVTEGIKASRDNLNAITGMQSAVMAGFLSQAGNVTENALDFGRSSLDTVSNFGRSSLDTVSNFGRSALEKIGTVNQDSLERTNETARIAIQTTERAYQTANQAQPPLDYNEAVKWLAGAVAVVGGLMFLRGGKA